jgi:glucosamine-6-phosphate deaminase
MNQQSQVNKFFLEKSGYQLSYQPVEKINAIIVKNFPELGRLTALRFIEWVQENPRGVISLPTGKTPEHFIKWVRYYLDNWAESRIKKELLEYGINTDRKPEMRNLHFIQMDEFYPINASQQNSFCNYVKKYYIEGFGLDPQKAMVIDCNTIGLKAGQTLNDIWPEGRVDLSLRERIPASGLEQKQKEMINKVDNWCDAYEKKIKFLGGIGFFLGGLGPDGHVAFNVRGSAHDSKTRLTETNYETQAAAAADMGGMEVTGQLPVITIGLETITRNPKCVAIIMAAGEAKSGMISHSIQNKPSTEYPASALHKLPGAIFYLTGGAAKLLEKREISKLKLTENIPEESITTAVIDLAISKNKRIIDLDMADFNSDQKCAMVLKIVSGINVPELVAKIDGLLKTKIENGTDEQSNLTFLHTEPHHDDIMLGYQPALVRDLHDRRNQHFFTTLTSGFTAVTNLCFSRRLNRSEKLLLSDDWNLALTANDEVRMFISGLTSHNDALIGKAEANRFLNCLASVFNSKDKAVLVDRIMELKKYLEDSFPGKKDSKDIQLLKGMIREWEVETLWGVFGVPEKQVSHLRLGFYQGDIFTEEPTLNRDIPPILSLMKEVKADILTVAMDPEASGPDTHYKVLQAIAETVRELGKIGLKLPTKIWGYRNVWYRFHPAEADLFVPVSYDELESMHHLFMKTFITQKEASFPSHEHDGPFSELAIKIQREQFEKMRICLGENWFQNHLNPRIRSCQAMVYLREMTVDTFLGEAREIKKQTENK